MPLFALLVLTAVLPATRATEVKLESNPTPVRVPLSGSRLENVDTAALFATLGADFFPETDATTYVQTGDIPAMWLRDSAAQTLPYVRFAPHFPTLARWIEGAIQRDARNILVAPYANAFSADYHVWENKWEVDSLAYPALLTYAYWEETHDRRTLNGKVRDALRTIVRTYACEQDHFRCSHYRPPTDPGRGADAAPTGMIWTAYRPSDDRATYPYNVPQQMLAAVALDDIATLELDGYHDRPLAERARAMAATIRASVEARGRVAYGSYGWIYAYEVDGRGGTAAMDDANLPNLVSAPYFGYVSQYDPTYLATRAFAFSADNPYYYRGRYATGLGSSHTPVGWVWPLGLIARALTATSAVETLEEVSVLSETDGEDGLLHESFDPNAYWHFTRAYFGWANALYAELIFRSAAGYTELPTGPPSLRHHAGWPSRPLTPYIADRSDRFRNRLAIESALCALFRFSAHSPTCAP